MIVKDKDDVDKNIHVLISQVLGIEPKTNVMSGPTHPWPKLITLLKPPG